MPDLRQTRKQLKMALGILAGVDVLMAVVFFSPLIGSAESRRMQMNQMQAELNTKTRQVAPLKDLPHKVDFANKQIAEFYKKRLPEQGSQIAAELGKLQSANGVTIEDVKYKVKDEEAGNLQPVEMEADLSGSYSSLAKFINALERDQMFFIIRSVTLGGEPRGTVKLNLKLDTYLRVAS
jgi:type IV pilus assembly protein PilO